MQAAYVFSVLLSTGNSLPLDIEDFGEYNNLLFSRCVKIQVSLDSKYAYFGFGVFLLLVKLDFSYAQEVFRVSSAVLGKKQNLLLNPHIQMASSFFLQTSHLQGWDFTIWLEIFSQTLHLSFTSCIPSNPPKFTSEILSHVCLTCFFIKSFRKCAYFLNSLTFRIGLKQNSSHPTHRTNLDGFFVSVQLSQSWSLWMVYAQVVLNLCYNQLIIDTRWTRTFLLDCSPPNYQNRWFHTRIECLQKASWSCIFFFVTSITLSRRSSFLSFFWSGFFNLLQATVCNDWGHFYWRSDSLPVLHELWIYRKWK